jgi:predicted PhzF superfamily epimerase YddE/YHI9
MSFCRYGINEDPVTGSAHCELADYWGKKLKLNAMVGYQASKRGGYVGIQLTSDGRIILSGDCASVITSELLV